MSLYIPICFYYHRVHDIRCNHSSGLYIPICFYYHWIRSGYLLRIPALHSNMFLLSRTGGNRTCIYPNAFTFQYVSIITGALLRSEMLENVFTFQYVSIITNTKGALRQPVFTLHSNMFLLSRLPGKTGKVKRVPLHSNMFLLSL